MKVVITGARGLLGRSCAACAPPRHEIIGFDVDTLDVTDREAVARALTEARPDAVIHCAAYTDVDGAEREERTALEVNADGAEWVARSAVEVGAAMVYISTDYVFDGSKAAPYRESDPPCPISRYGFSKLEGERRVVESCPNDHLIVRTAWLYGAGAGFVDWVLSGLDQGRSLLLVTDHRGSPTYAMDLAGGIFRLVERGHRGIFHYVNQGETTWYELGRTVARMTGKNDGLLGAVAAEELRRAAPRPSYSVLAVQKYEQATGERVARWQDALERYLASAGRLGPAEGR